MTVVGKGRIKIKKGKEKRALVSARSFRLKKLKRSVEPGKGRVLRLKPKKKDHKKVLKRLMRGKDLRAHVSVKLTD